jgi:hypothetical protein
MVNVVLANPYWSSLCLGFLMGSSIALWNRKSRADLMLQEVLQEAACLDAGLAFLVTWTPAAAMDDPEPERENALR